jgi:hypothetical protein
LKHPKVIPLKHVAARIPITSTIAWWLLLDRLRASDLVWGIMGTLCAVVWIMSVVALCIQEPVELKELSDRESVSGRESGEH